MPDLPIYVDVDGTLTETPHEAWGPPRMDRIAKVREMIAEGVYVIVWSARGGAYAYAFADRYGIETLCLGKPSKCIDDKPGIRGKLAVLSPEEFFGA